MSVQSNKCDSIPFGDDSLGHPSTAKAENSKFGTFVGVFIPCILMLFGVIIFLRLGWIVGQVGLSTTIIIITLAALIALITSLSMASIATNIEVGQGGVYYMLSRSLGLEVGSAIGIPLFLKESLTIAFCIIGFSESIYDLFPFLEIKYISMATLLVLSILAFTSISGALKVQIGIFITIIAALISFFCGGEVSFMQSETFTPPPLESLKFWAVFALFFPAMTGMESSVSLSGNLRNPSKSLPIGTISAILVAYFTYIAISVYLVKFVPMDRLAQDPNIMRDMARFPLLIILGIWGATLSSAIGGLLGAPRALQAIANDGIIPKIFGRTFGALNEPRIATLATCAIALIGVFFGSVNQIAPLLATISLICYTVLNLSAGIESLMGNPSWRPLFRVHWIVSLTGSALCLVTMLLIDAGSALISMLLVMLIYCIINKRKFKVSWMDIRQGILLFFSRFAIYQLTDGACSPKSWRPNFLVFTKSSESQSTSLLKFSEAISQNKGFLTMASFVPLGTKNFRQREEMSKIIAKNFRKKNIHAFIQIKEADSVTSGMHQMIEYYGLGPIIPNTVIFGGATKEGEAADFASVLRFAYKRLLNIIMISDDNNIEENPIERNNEIHIWWDQKNQYNSQLMLVLAYMIQRNPKWKKKRICVKTIVMSELMKENELLQFQKINRLPLDIEVLVSSDTFEEKLELIKKFSSDAAITFVGMSVPPQKNEQIEEYIQYLQRISEASKNHPQLAFVLSSKNSDLETILN